MGDKPLPAGTGEVVHLHQSLCLHPILQGEGLDWGPDHWVVIPTQQNIHIHTYTLYIVHMCTYIYYMHVHTACVENMIIHVHRALLNRKERNRKEKDQKGNPPNHHTVHVQVNMYYRVGRLYK